MGGGCRVQHTGSGIRNVSYNSSQLQRIHKLYSRVSSANYTEGNNTAGALWQIFFSQFMLAVLFQTGEGNTGYLRVLFQMLC